MATNLTFTGDSNDAQAAIAKIERKFAEMENRAVQFGKKAKAAGDDGFESFLKMGQSVTGITSTLDLASKGVALLANEYKALIALQDKSAEANSTFGATFTKLALNAGAGADVNKEKLRVLMLSTEAGVSPDKLTTIMSIAQAAKGGLSDEVVNNTIIEASKLSKHSPDDMGKLVGLSLDIQKANPKVNPRQALAFSLNSAAEARVDDAAEYSKNVMPAALAISQLDKTGIEFPAAAAGAFTQGKGDTTGRTSRTAILAMHFQLEKALPHLKSFEDRVNYAQDNPEFTKAFFEGTTHKGKHLPPMDMQVVGPNGETFSFSGNKASFETPSLPWAKLLLTKGSTVDDNLRRIHKTVPSMDNSEASFNARAKGMAEDPNMMVADTRNAINVQKELNYLNNTEAAKESVARRDVFDLLASEGFGSFHGFKTGVSAWTSTLMGKSYAQGLQEELEAQEAYHTDVGESALKFGDDRAAEEHLGKARKLGRVLSLAPGSGRRNSGGEWSDEGSSIQGGDFGSEETLKSATKAIEELTAAIRDQMQDTKTSAVVQSPRAGRPVNRGGNSEQRGE